MSRAATVSADRRCTPGCGDTPQRDCRASRTAAPALARVRTRCRRRSRPGSWRCGGSIRAGGRARSSAASCRAGVSPLPSRSAIYRALVRHQLIDPKARRQAAQRLQALGAVTCDGALADGRHARRAAAGRLASVDRDRHRRPLAVLRVGEGRRARARPGRCATRCSRPCAVTACLRASSRTTERCSPGRFGPHKGEVLFDRICRERGIRHLLTAPASPTTTGQGRALPQDAEAGVPRRQGLRVGRRGAGRARRVGARLQPQS